MSETVLYVAKCIEISMGIAYWKCDNDQSAFASPALPNYKVGHVYKCELWTGGTCVPICQIPNYRAQNVRIRLRLVA